MGLEITLITWDLVTGLIDKFNGIIHYIQQSSGILCEFFLLLTIVFESVKNVNMNTIP